MPALLTSIVFEEKTKDALLQSMAERQETEMALDTIDTFTHLGRDAIPLDHLADGDYILIVKMNLERSTAAQLTLMAAETRDVVRQTVLDLHPIIETAVLCHDDYLNAISDLEDKTATKDEKRQAESRMTEIGQRRNSFLEGILAPYITNNDAFNNELLDVLDFATMWYIEDKILNDVENGLAEEPAHANTENRILNDGYDPSHNDKLNHPLNRHLPHSKLLH